MSLEGRNGTNCLKERTWAPKPGDCQGKPNRKASIIMEPAVIGHARKGLSHALKAFFYWISEYMEWEALNLSWAYQQHSIPTLEAETLKFPHRWESALSGVDAQQILCEGEDSGSWVRCEWGWKERSRRNTLCWKASVLWQFPFFPPPALWLGE